MRVDHGIERRDRAKFAERYRSAVLPNIRNIMSGHPSDNAESWPARRGAPETDLVSFARGLRRDGTDVERLLWLLLRDRRFWGAKFRRQFPVAPYVLDFYCHEARLAVELDGGGHNSDSGKVKDEARSRFLATRGIRVIRFWNNAVFEDTESVLDAIGREIRGTRAK